MSLVLRTLLKQYVDLDIALTQLGVNKHEAIFTHHFAFFLLYVLNFGIIFVLYDAVDGFQNNKFYFVVLSLYLFICFLAYRYVRNRRMYHRLSEQPEKWKMRLLKEQLLRCLTVSMNSCVRSTASSKRTTIV